MKHSALLLACLCAIALGTARAGERERVKVGVCFSMTGDFAEYGKAYLPGVRIAVDAHNADPDRLYDVELLVRDDESDAAKAVAIVRELADAENVVAILGSITSDVTLAMREETKKRGLVMITPSATNAVLGTENDGVVRVLFNDAFQGTALARYSLQNLGFRKAAILTNTRYDYSKAISDAFAAEFAAGGGTVRVEEYAGGAAEVEALDFRPLLERIDAWGAETVVISCYAADVIAILLQAQSLGMAQRFCGGDAWHHQETLLAAGNALEGAYYVSVMEANSPAAQNRRFRELMDRTNYEADDVSAQGYDTMLILQEALKNGTTRAAVFEGVYGIRDLPIVSGRITMSREEGSRTSASIVELRKDGNGLFTGTATETINP